MATKRYVVTAGMIIEAEDRADAMSKAMWDFRPEPRMWRSEIHPDEIVKCDQCGESVRRAEMSRINEGYFCETCMCADDEEHGRCDVCGDTLDEFGCCPTCDDEEYEDDDKGSCERCGKVLRSHEIEICTECALDIDDGDDALDYDDEEEDDNGD